MNAVSYAGWLAKQHRIDFNLPTEQEWIFAAAPFGLEYPWGMQHSREKAHVFTHDKIEGPLKVDDPRFGVNWCGLYHMGGNIQEFVFGTNYAPGTNGAAVDGMYCITKGGDWCHCPRSAGVHRRGNELPSRSRAAGYLLK